MIKPFARGALNNRFLPSRVFAAWLGLLFSAVTLFAKSGLPDTRPPCVISGDVRVELLSDSLVRLELKGPAGFENRPTFHVVNRNWPGTAFTTNLNAGAVMIQTANYLVRVPQNATSLKGVRVESSDGRTLYAYNGKLENSRWLPGPADHPQVWWFADTPRIVPPPWGLTPAPREAPLPKTSGWDLSNNAPDVYVFVPRGSYFTLRKDFLKLTGPTEMPPLFAFGAWDSRWYDYSETTALKQIEAYRSRKIPLDVLVCDTGWRKGASTGYQPNTNLFPNLPRFFREAHAKHVHVMFNDHPEPVAKTALAPKELNYRYAGLSGLLNDGLDVWWYDRNWMVHLLTPAPNLDRRVWGMRLYHDITLRVRPGIRPMIMGNVDGIDNGIRHHPMDAAAHRFPIQWTGDIGPGYDFLRRAVENAVHSGVQSLFPYESDDLGGHVANPTTEQYIRWIEYGALSPIYRPHCTHNLERMPWVFGPEAERVARRFLDMRYRLLPVWYAAAHRNYETGSPLLRRLDLDYPQFTEARREDEYLIGHGILVAPVLRGSLQAVPGDWLKTADGKPGLQAEYYGNTDLSGQPAVKRIDSAIDFDWNGKSPVPGVPGSNFSARWTGTIEVPKSVGDVKLATLADDGARVWIDGKEVLNAWGPHAATTTEASVTLTAGQPHRLRIEYLQLNFGDVLKLEWRSATNRTARRSLWVPPGIWINAWTGGITKGPAKLTEKVPLDQTPIYIKSGTVLPLAPQMQYTGQKPWNPITLDVYPSGGAPVSDPARLGDKSQRAGPEAGAPDSSQAVLYEDDTITTAYQQGAFRNTIITASADNAAKTVSVNIGAAKGTFSGELLQRAWVLRIHPPVGWPKNLTPTEITINGQKLDAPVRVLPCDATAMPFGDKAGAPDAEVFQVKLPATSVFEDQRLKIAFGPAQNR